MSEVSSAYTGIQSATVSPASWYLKDVIDPTKQMPLPVRDISFNAEIDQAVFSPLGRTRNVVVQDVARGEMISTTLIFTTQAAYLAFEVLRKSLRTLLLQSDSHGEQWYVRMGSGTRNTSLYNNAARLTAPLREVSVEFIEVDRP